MKNTDSKFIPAGYSLFFFRKINPRWLIFAIDSSICAFSIIVAFLLRFNFNISVTGQKLYQVVLLVLAIRIASFIIIRAYAGIVRHTNVKDIFRIMMIIVAGTFGLVIMNLVSGAFGKGYPVPFSIIGIDFFATSLLMIMYRMGIKVMYMEFGHSSVPKSRVLIYGSKDTAMLAKRTLELDPKIHYRVVAFISTSDLTVGKQFEGVNIYPFEDLRKVIYKYNVDQLIFASSKLNSDLEASIVHICLSEKVRVFNMTHVRNWMDGTKNSNRIKEFRIEDLLSRDPIELNKVAIRNQLENKTILVTGAAGSIGSEIVRQIMKFSFKRLILIDQAETPLFNLEFELDRIRSHGSFEFIVADITSKQRMDKIFSIHRPDIVFHAAAYKHVPMMEGNPIEAIRNNVIGTKILADLSSNYNVSKFIFISSDKAVNPTNVMGASKRIAEMYVQAMNNLSGTSFITTRFGNVLGSNGSVIPLFSKQIESGGPVTVTHPEVRRYFMTIPEASQLVLEAGACGKGGEIFVFDMGKSVKILDLAKNMIKLAGLEPNVDITIEYTGLRPGEKLYEELLHQAENTLETHHPKILIAKVRQRDYGEVSRLIEVLEEAVSSQNAMLVVRVMKKIVPEFISKNSVFEEIDQEINCINKLRPLQAV